LRGILLFALLVVPWYAYMTVRLPGFLSAHFVNEQIGASLNCRYPADAKQLPVWQFYLQHLLFWMPWMMLLPGAIYVALRGLRADRKGNEAVEKVDVSLTPDLIKMLVCWFGLVMVSVAFSTRQDYYSMASWGVVAGFLALPWMGEEVGLGGAPRRFLFVPSLLIGSAGAVALGFSIWIAPQLSSLGEATAAPIRKRDTFFDAIAGISPALWGHFVALLAIFSVAMLVAGAASAVLSSQRRPFPALLVLSAGMAVPVVLAAIGFTMMAPYFSLAENARAINREIASEPDAVVACEALPHTASSLFYYLNARVHWVNAPFYNQYAQQVLGQGRDYYWDEAGLEEAWTGTHPIYLIIEETRLDYWQASLPNARLVSKSGTRLVLCNR
jgi:hypothetical protein